MNKKAMSYGRLAMIGFGFLCISPLLRWPNFVFKTVTWGTSIIAHIWFIAYYIIFLALMGFCFYAGVTAED